MKKLKSYGLSLTDGSAWCIIAVNGAEDWLDRLASIMMLKPCGGENRRRFVVARKASHPDGRLDPLVSMAIGQPLPEDGWAVQDLKCMRIMLHPGVPDIICDIDEEKDNELEFIRMWLSLLQFYLGSQEHGGLPFHAALAEKDGKGVLICAPGGTGKSTCSRRLPASWNSLCDDETLVVRTSGGVYMAHPFPTWSDYLWRRSVRTWRVERPVPVSALFFLEQSDVDEAARIGQAQAAVMINQSASQVCMRGWAGLAPEAKRTLKIKLFDNACMLARELPSFILRASLEGRFWDEMEKQLSIIKGEMA